MMSTIYRQGSLSPHSVMRPAVMTVCCSLSHFQSHKQSFLVFNIFSINLVSFWGELRKVTWRGFLWHGLVLSEGRSLFLVSKDTPLLPPHLRSKYFPLLSDSLKALVLFNPGILAKYGWNTYVTREGENVKIIGPLNCSRWRTWICTIALLVCFNLVCLHGCPIQKKTNLYKKKHIGLRSRWTHNRQRSQQGLLCNVCSPQDLWWPDCNCGWRGKKHNVTFKVRWQGDKVCFLKKIFIFNHSRLKTKRLLFPQLVLLLQLQPTVSRKSSGEEIQSTWAFLLPHVWYEPWIFFFSLHWMNVRQQHRKNQRSFSYLFFK